MSGKGVVSMFRRVVDRIRGHAGVVTELDHINLEILATFGQPVNDRDSRRREIPAPGELFFPGPGRFSIFAGNF